MSHAVDPELYEQAVSLLGPGDITLHGVVVHTDVPRADEPTMNDATRRIGDLIAERVGEPDAYVYAGQDDPQFAAGHFQGRRLADDGFVWECQQLLRNGSFDLVFYWEATGTHGEIVQAIGDLGFEVVPVTEDGYGSAADDDPDADGSAVEEPDDGPVDDRPPAHVDLDDEDREQAADEALELADDEQADDEAVEPADDEPTADATPTADDDEPTAEAEPTADDERPPDDEDADGAVEDEEPPA